MIQHGLICRRGRPRRRILILSIAGTTWQVHCAYHFLSIALLHHCPFRGPFGGTGNLEQISMRWNQLPPSARPPSRNAGGKRGPSLSTAPSGFPAFAGMSGKLLRFDQDLLWCNFRSRRPTERALAVASAETVHSKATIYSALHRADRPVAHVGSARRGGRPHLQSQPHS